jgi:Cys-rich repeat protein
MQFCRVLTGECVDCLNSDQCDAGELCRTDGTCGSSPLGCTSDTNCAGLRCLVSSGECVQCLTSGDCPSGQTCRDNHACFTTGGTGGGGGAPFCDAQSDCDPMGKICNLTTSACVNCTSDPQCGDGKRCAAGTCTTAPGGGGGGTGGGDIGGSCESRADCDGLACFLNVCQPCFVDFMCWELMDLLTGESMVCSDEGECVLPECSSASDCAAGEGCYDGHCGGCLYDDECRAGEVCDVASEMCVPDDGGGEDPGGEDPGGEDPGGEDPGGGTPGTGMLGETCSATSGCAAGLTCLTVGTTSRCSRPCIGSGNRR